MTDRGRIAWAISGSGHDLAACLQLVEELAERQPVDLFVSRAGAEVLQVYGHPLKQLAERHRIFRDSAASAPPIGHFYHGVYERLILAPATSNSVAKMVCGISDTLVTNAYAHAGKCRVPSIVYACDAAPQLQSEAPSGTVTVYPRPIDLSNTERLRAFPLTEVVTSVEQLRQALWPERACRVVCSS